MTFEQAMIHTLTKENDKLQVEIGRLRQLLERQSCEDCVSRQAVLDLINADWKYEGLELPVKNLPPVTPTQKWIPVERREPTQEEKEEYLSAYGEELGYMVESRMPDDGEEVLVSWGGSVLIDVFSYEYFDFENISIDEIEAWMPLPQPYEEKRGGENGSN